MSSDRTHQDSATVMDLFQPDVTCKFVDVEEFCNLAVSRRSLVRCDEAESPMRGLFDPQTGIKYLIEEAALFQRRR